MWQLCLTPEDFDRSRSILGDGFLTLPLHIQVTTGEAALRGLLQDKQVAEGALPWDAIFRVLQDSQRPPDGEIPRSGAFWSIQHRQCPHNNC